MAFLSDDLPPAERARVEGHLALCWPCKELHLALRDQMLEIRETAQEECVLGRDRIEQARRKFFTRFSELESEQEAERIATPVFPSVSRRGGHRALASRLAIAAAFLCVLALSAWLALRPSPVEFDKVITQTLEREDGLRRAQGPLHQEFDIDIRQVKPVEPGRSGLLRVWYDSDGERFAGRWEREDGELQYAVWRPEPDREFVFDAQLGAAAVARAPQSGRTITLGELSFEQAGLEQLETGFLYWLANRRWEPISIASDLNVFRMREGVVAEIEAVTAENGDSVYRITARRETAWGAVEVVAEVDAATYRPTIELLRLVSADRVVELRLRAHRTQWLDSGAIEKAVFWPSVDIQGQENAAELQQPRERRSETRPLRDRSSIAATAADLDLAEMQARYALHEAGACLGVPVRVDRSEPGHVRVEGLVESAERKQELLVRLSGISAAPFVSIDIKTVDEALSSSSAAGIVDQRGDAAAVQPANTQTGDTFEVVASDSPIQEALQRYVRQAQDSVLPAGGSANDDEIQRKASEFSDRVLSNSLANLTEAWAVRRLAERYGDSAQELPEPAAALLREMLAAHVAALLHRTADIQQHVRPLLLAVAPAKKSAASGEPGRVAQEPAAEQEQMAEQSWAALGLGVFQEVESTEALTTGLFADSGFANGNRREASAEHAAAALLRALPRLESRLQRLQEHLIALDRQPPASGLAVDGSRAREGR